MIYSISQVALYQVQISGENCFLEFILDSFLPNCPWNLPSLGASKKNISAIWFIQLV